LVKRIQQIVFSIDKDQVISAVTTLNSLVAETLARPKFNAVLLGLLAGFAIVLAVLGIYGVMSYSVTQRTQEIGIRLALGARTSDVIGLVVNHGMRLAVVGITLGLLGSYVLSRFLTSLLFGVQATDPATYILLSLTLLVVARLACYLPARRAARIDPMVALRCE
ncbi:MAG TPA: FtsX-like permease family protein, partial [Acidobacteriota bacterium]|nr:FtsX-like permease family protein [Acidobacteriota bacterium]